MKRLTYVLAASITLAGLSGCGSSTGTVNIEPDESIVRPEQIALVIDTLKSDELLANRFGVNQCLKLGTAAAEALPDLEKLRARTRDTEYLGRIDAAIAAVKGEGDAAGTPPES